MVIIFGIGFIAMKQIDKFIYKNSTSPGKSKIDNTDNPYVLIFGRSELGDKLTQILEINKINYRLIEDENQLNQTYYFSHLFAISNSDLSNLMITIHANRYMETYEKVAICNSYENQTIFKQNNIHYFYKTEISAEALFTIMFNSADKNREYGNDN
jgi:hypothetical protein